MVTSLGRSQPHFTAFIFAQKSDNPENFAKIGRVLSGIVGVEPIVKPESVSAVRVILGHETVMMPFDRPHTVSRLPKQLHAYVIPFRRYSVTKIQSTVNSRAFQFGQKSFDSIRFDSPI